MIIVEPSVELITATPDIHQIIEKIGRVCHKSEDRITEKSYRKFIKKLVVELQHESVIEHGVVTLRIVCDRGISHEIIRHRIASFSQESTRYCNYSNDKFGNQISVIQPVELVKPEVIAEWRDACEYSEKKYFNLLNQGCSPQTARSVLPTCLRTEVYMTTNCREWRHIIKLRKSKKAHPDMRVIATKIEEALLAVSDTIFENIPTQET